MDFTNLKRFMDHLTAWRMPGNSVVVYQDNKCVFSYQSGYASLEEKRPMAGGELFNIYSCSKPCTVTAALQLYEKGLFLLDDPLYEYIPEFRDMTVQTENGEIVKAKSPITMRHLFTMTAGFDYNTNAPWRARAEARTQGKMQTLEVVKELAKDPLHFHPGEKWNYSLCHDVLAAAVEAISGQKFRDYVKAHVFDPLDMKTSCYHSDTVLDRVCEQYRFEQAGDNDAVKLQSGQIKSTDGVIVNVGKKPLYYVFGEEYDSGGAGVTTSIEDYAKFANALSNGGLGATGERILGNGTIELLRTNQLSEEQSRTFTWEQLRGYGYGLGVRTVVDRAKSGFCGPVAEFGWGGAAGATIIVDPELHLGVFYAHHMLNPQETYYQPRLRNVIYSCL
ncbi:MAG: beta-lactamase family protein [Clostridia bacterium]|nr:beta-lactamase family protein [Clostridia bacterium]MBQ9807230.1 beta-lactamase family protein [Clostridia bacterium]